MAHQYFHIEFEKLLENPQEIKNSDICNFGLFCISQNIDVKQKEEILSKLIFLYPEKSELYYHMGDIFYDIDKIKSLMWYRMCYQYDPLHKENALKLINILLEKKNDEYIKFLCKENNELETCIHRFFKPLKITNGTPEVFPFSSLRVVTAEDEMGLCPIPNLRRFKSNNDFTQNIQTVNIPSFIPPPPPAPPMMNTHSFVTPPPAPPMMNTHSFVPPPSPPPPPTTNNKNPNQYINKENLEPQYLYSFSSHALSLCLQKPEEKQKELAYYHDILNKVEHLDNIAKYYVYLNLSSLYCGTANIEKSLYYLNKNIEAHKILDEDEEREYLLSHTYNSYLIQCDYVYTDNKYRNEKCKIFTNLFKNEKLFSFKKHSPLPGKINIGYLSNNFFGHATSNFIFPILEYHDKTKFNITLFTDFETANSSSELLKIYVQLITEMGIKIVDLYGKPSTYVASIINLHKIDILIDLDGHTKNTRIDVMSKNPAPVQMTYIGYPNSTGLDFVKYRIVDKITDPADSTQIYSETRLYMPKCFLLFKSILQTAPLPVRYLKKNDTIILGSLNKEIKYSRELIATWKEIMHKTTNTKLLIKLEDDNLENQLAHYKSIFDLSDDRLIVKKYGHKNDYIDMIGQIDILLDTFPYSGTTTTCNVLYNSIPVVTLYNKDYHAHCVTSSILINCGLEELVTYSQAAYITKVIELCNNYEKINEYKSCIHSKFMELMNPEEFMPNYEKLLIQTIKDYYAKYTE